MEDILEICIMSYFGTLIKHLSLIYFLSIYLVKYYIFVCGAAYC